MSGVACLLVGGPEYVIEIGVVVYPFEMHSQCGPMPLEELGHKHEFWRAVTLWIKQGQRVEIGIAIWEEPKEDHHIFKLREIKLCDCGEQMFRERSTEPWTCWPCEFKRRKVSK